MIYTEMTKKAMRLCLRAHDGQTDKGGTPYVFHPIHLAEQMRDEESTVCALLHDVAEDTDLTTEDLQEEGFPESVIEALALLTHSDGVAYMDYIRAIGENRVAAAVKIADLRHNSDLTRLDCPCGEDLRRAEKYARALDILESSVRRKGETV